MQVAAFDALIDSANDPSAPARQLSGLKGSQDHAIGLSIGGLSTKIRVAIDEIGLPILMMRPIQARDLGAPLFLPEPFKAGSGSSQPAATRSNRFVSTSARAVEHRSASADQWTSDASQSDTKACARRETGKE